MVFGFGKRGKEKTISKYAPKYNDHGPQPVRGGQAEAYFPNEWSTFKGELLTGMSGEYPKIDNGEGPKHTIYSDSNLRYDREKRCQSYGHPQDRFQDYSVQANREARSQYLRHLAAGNNGRNKVEPVKSPDEPHTFGGSTVASVNLQQNTGRLSSERVCYAIDHSAKYAESLYVLNRQSNLDYVPGGMRQAGAIYHSNPFEAWPDRQDPRNLYHGCADDGTLPQEGQYYYINGVYYLYQNGQYVRASY